MKVAVLGAGHGGEAMAADLTLTGHEARLAAVPEHATNLIVLKSFGGVFLEGVTSSGKPPGFAKLALITDDVAEAVRGAEVVMVVVPAFAQETYMRELIRCGEEGQIIVFNPGKFGSLVFAKMLCEEGLYGKFLIGETASLIYAAKMSGTGHVKIKACKSDLYYAAFPSVKTAPTLDALLDLFPQLTPARNVFQTSVDDIAYGLHPVTTLMNASRIEQMGPYRTGHYDITPSIGNVIMAVDAERLEISQKLHNETLSLLGLYDQLYHVTGQSVYDVIMGVHAYDVQTTPGSLDHRYVTEELPYGLVPLSELGRIIGVKTPGIDAIVQLGSMALKREFWKSGYTLEKMGLDGLDLNGLVRFATYGPPRREP